MKTTRFATVSIVLAASMATPAFARDDGPRLAQDRLDALVAQHAEAARSIAKTGHDVQRAQTTRDMHEKASS